MIYLRDFELALNNKAHPKGSLFKVLKKEERYQENKNITDYT